MVQTAVNLDIDPEIIRKLGSENDQLWAAAHDDGSKNRIDGDAVLEASGYSVFLGFLTAGLMWIRKKYRNRGKTGEDFAAEKEAARINRTSAALQEMLLEYIRAAREGMTDAENLDELIDTLDEIDGYYRSGKLIVTGEQELSEIRNSIEEYITANEEDADCQSAGPAVPEADEFRLIMDLLVRQKKLLGRNEL